MSSVPDPVEDGLSKLMQWTDHDPYAPPAVRRAYFEASTWGFLNSNRIRNRTPKRFSRKFGEAKTAGEQVELLLSRFVSGLPLIVDQDVSWFRSAIPPFVWELRTSDLRLFGVFIKKDCLVVCSAGLADNLHDEKHPVDHEGLARRALTQLAALPAALQTPIEGSDPDAVLTNIT
jgi:hypothetical protein